MKDISRRNFIRRVAEGLFAFVPAALVLSDLKVIQTDVPTTAPPDQDGRVENYAEGLVQKLGPKRIVIDTTYLGEVKLLLSDKSSIWKGDYKGTYPIQVGDQVVAWGEPEQHGKVIAVEKMWVNIVNVRGTISDVRNVKKGTQLRLIDSQQGTYRILFDQETIFILPNRQEKTYDHEMEMTERQFLQVIGLKLEDGSIKAGRVWIAH